MKDIFTTFLKELHVAHTEYSHILYEKHPYYNSLYAISEALTRYDIPNVCLRIPAEELKKIDTPFLACFENDFVIVKDIQLNEVKYIWNGNKYVISFEDFLSVWSGIVLVAEPTEFSKEPDYKRHSFAAIFKYTKKTLLFVSMLLFAVLSLQIQEYKYYLPVCTNIIGMYICLLLLLKQNQIDSKMAEHLCHLLKHQNCSDILESERAKIFSFSWSEVGWSYFLSNLIILCYFPNSSFIAVYSNVLALPFTIWSVWYQYRTHQWCTLCLIVQILLWIIFVENIFLNLFTNFEFDICLLYPAILYAAILLATNLIQKTCAYKRTYFTTLRKCNKIKFREDVTNLLFKNDEKIYVNECTSQITFGNVKSKLCITVLTNPHCNPCAKMHDRLQKLIRESPNDICIQYIFSAFNVELLNSNRILIAAYLQYNQKDAEHIFHTWFEKGKYEPEKFAKLYNLDLNSIEVENELQKHEMWRKSNRNFRETPFLFLNGRVFPNEYEIEDLDFILINLK